MPCLLPTIDYTVLYLHYFIPGLYPMRTVTAPELTTRFTEQSTIALQSFDNAKAESETLKGFGVAVEVMGLDTATIYIMQSILGQLCQELTTVNQGMGRDILAPENYYKFLHAEGFRINSLEKMDFEGMATALNSDSEVLEQSGYASSAKLLTKNLLGYNLDNVKRSKTQFQCPVSVYNYTFDAVKVLRELKSQFEVALLVTGEADVNLDCIDVYIDELNKYSYVNEVQSRMVFGNKTDRFYITHFKDKFVMHIAPVLFDALVAFMCSFHPDDINFEVPQAA